MTTAHWCAGFHRPPHSTDVSVETNEGRGVRYCPRCFSVWVREDVTEEVGR